MTDVTHRLALAPSAWILFAPLLLTLIGCAHMTMDASRHFPQQTFEYSPYEAIDFEVHGHGSIPVLYLHGFGASLDTWNDIKPLLDHEAFTHYFLDLKGFGLSSKPKDSNYTMLDQARIIKRFVDASALENPIVVGHSYGGAVALVLAVAEGGQDIALPMRKLILIDSPAYPQELPFFVEHLRMPVVSWIMLNIVPATWRARYTLKHIFHDTAAVTDERIQRYARFFDLEGAHHSFVKTAEQIVPKDYDRIVQRYTNVTIPVLLIWGRNDVVVGCETGKRLAHDLPRARLYLVDRAGHVPQEECPTEVARVMNDFMLDD